jgi:hypothetical protein
MLGSSSESPTVSFPEAESAKTQRLNQRPTSPESIRAAGQIPVYAGGISSDAHQQTRGVRMILTATAIAVLLIVVLISAVSILKIRSHSRTATLTTLIYPGSQIILDVTAEGGGRAIHLQTHDSLNQAVEWYTANINPTKTIHPTATTVVLKNESAVVTITTEDNQTNILIKQTTEP